MNPVYILAIESSCDDTSAAILCNKQILSNIVANQEVHRNFGGVVPELASRAHLQNIIPVVAQAIHKANINKNQLSAIAYTNGPGLLGSLLVGTSFAKGLAIGLNLPLITVNHLEAHVLAHFIDNAGINNNTPEFPFLCLLVSGGHTQIIRVDNPSQMEIIGSTIDDAAGEAFDKAAKIMNIPYPGGPLIDKMAKNGNPDRFVFPHPSVTDLNFSFSGLKTSILYFLRDNLAIDTEFIEKNKDDLCASIQKTIVSILINKVCKAVKDTGIPRIAIAGGVSANSGLRQAFIDLEHSKGYTTYLPKFEYTTDNAAMIAIAGYFKYLNNNFASLDEVPFTRNK